MKTKIVKASPSKTIFDKFIYSNLAKISSTASLAMEKLLTEYLKLLLPQTKPIETAEKDRIKSPTNNTTESIADSNSTGL